jgi:hypothetical protein
VALAITYVESGGQLSGTMKYAALNQNRTYLEQQRLRVKGIKNGSEIALDVTAADGSSDTYVGYVNSKTLVITMGGKKITMQIGSEDIYQKSTIAMSVEAKKTSEEKSRKATLIEKELAEQKRKEAQQLQTLTNTQSKIMTPLTNRLRESGKVLGETLDRLLYKSTQIGEIDLEKASRMYDYILDGRVECISDTNFFTNKQDFMSQLESELQILNQSKLEIGKNLSPAQKAWKEYKDVVAKNPKAEILLSKQELLIIESNLNDSTTGIKNIPNITKSIQNSIDEWNKKWDKLNTVEKIRGC